MIVRARSFTAAVYLTAAVFTGVAISTIQSGPVWVGSVLLGVGCSAWWSAGFIKGATSIVAEIRREHDEQSASRSE